MTALTAQGMTIMHLFVVQVMVGKTHGDTEYRVHKQTNALLSFPELIRLAPYVGKAPPLSLQPTSQEWAGCLQW